MKLVFQGIYFRKRDWALMLNIMLFWNEGPALPLILVCGPYGQSLWDGIRGTPAQAPPSFWPSRPFKTSSPISPLILKTLYSIYWWIIIYINLLTYYKMHPIWWALTNEYTCTTITTIKTKNISIILKHPFESFFFLVNAHLSTSSWCDHQSAFSSWSFDLRFLSLSPLLPAFGSNTVIPTRRQSCLGGHGILSYTGLFISILDLGFFFSAPLNCSISSWWPEVPGALPGICQSDQDFHWVRSNSFQRG